MSAIQNEDNPLERKIQKRSFQFYVESARGVCTKEAESYEALVRISRSTAIELKLESGTEVVICIEVRRERSAS